MEERMGQAVMQSLKALSLIPWFATDFLVTLIQALVVHMLLIWIFFLLLLKVWSEASLWLTSQNAEVVWCKYFPALQGVNVTIRWCSPSKRQRGGRAGAQHGCVLFQTTAECGPCRLVWPAESGQLCEAETDVMQHGDMPKLGTQSRIAMAAHCTSPASNPKLATIWV